MTQQTKTLKQVCKCENCGNEAEMIITCTLEEDEPEKEAPPVAADSGEATKEAKKVKGSAKCSHCGGEADMWVDF